MTKWTGELQDPPFWLSLQWEVTAASDAPKLSKAQFLIQSVDALRRAGCSFQQAVDVTANAVNETGWGRFYRAWNLGGWKITKGTAHEPDGTPRRWFRALGNKSSGDPQTCFYRAFTSLQAFYEAWLLQFVPKEGSPTGRYTKTGQQFWAGEEWFDDLIAAGYKGDVTRRNPDPSMRAHASIKGTVVVYYCQHKLGVVADGKWGPKSIAACRAVQENIGIKNADGKLTAQTIALIVGELKDCGPLANACEQVKGDESDDDSDEFPSDAAPSKKAEAPGPETAGPEIDVVPEIVPEIHETVPEIPEVVASIPENVPEISEAAPEPVKSSAQPPVEQPKLTKKR